VKERLTGAIILVALVVLLVPELLTGPLRSTPRAAALATSAEEAPLRSYTINLAEDAHARAASHASGPEQPAPLSAAAPPSSAAASDAPSATPDTTAQPAPAAAPSAPPAAAAPSAPTPAASTTTESAAGGWVVQLGSFASRANAERLAHAVRARGFTVSVSQGSSGRRLYRVRVGPVKDHGAANELAAKLRAQGHSGAIVPQ
jgi:cell division septation protein DedD